MNKGLNRMRTLLIVGVTLLLAVPAAIGGALWWAERMETSADLSELDRHLVAQSVTAEAPPLALAPETPPAAGTPQASPSLADLADGDREGAKALVRQALLDDPTILQEAIEALETLRATQETDQMAQVIAANAGLLFDSANASILGNPEGTVTLVEFLDYNCGFCKRAHDDVMRLIAEHPDLRVVVKDFPVLGPGSLEAAQVAVAYRSLGGDMTAFIDAMMREDEAPANADLAMRIAADLGADPDRLSTTLEDPGLMESIGEAYGLAEQLGIRGTPAFIVGEERIMGAVGFDRLTMAVQAERERLATR